MSDYKIIFAPELELSATDFVDSWNSIEPCRELTEVQTGKVVQGQFVFGVDGSLDN